MSKDDQRLRDWFLDVQRMQNKNDRYLGQINQLLAVSEVMPPNQEFAAVLAKKENSVRQDKSPVRKAMAEWSLAHRQQVQD